MKKRFLPALCVLLMVCILAACAQGADKKTTTGSEKDAASEVTEDKGGSAEVFEERNGKLYVLEKNEKFGDSPALAIEVDKAAQTITMTPADEKGTTGKDYYIFNFKDMQMEKYYYVSMMGTGHYYYYDLTTKELVKLENEKHEDATESSKQAGRWDSAVEATREEAEELQAIFEKVAGASMEDFINQ